MISKLNFPSQFQGFASPHLGIPAACSVRGKVGFSTLTLLTFQLFRAIHFAAFASVSRNGREMIKI